MRLWTKLLLLGFLILLINSAYLISFGEPTLFYIGNVLIHVVLGVALIIRLSSMCTSASPACQLSAKAGRFFWESGRFRACT